jgi:RHS repeat-associated protein
MRNTNKGKVMAKFRSKISRFSLPIALRAGALIAALLASLLAVSPSMAYSKIWVQPVFLYADSNDSLPYETTVQQAFADIKADPLLTYCSYGGDGSSSCKSYLDYHPDYSLSFAVIYNGTVEYTNWLDYQICQTPAGGQTTCNTYTEQGYIQAMATCPAGFYTYMPTGTGSNPTYQTVSCYQIAQDPAPSHGCLSCAGNSILAASGAKVQSESDYASPTGLSFSRTYRSDVGSWGSIASVAFIDYSQPNATISNGCYQSHYTNPTTHAIVPTCFPYFSTAINAYQLATSDGSYLNFSGPNNAVTQNADINDRVTQVTIGGVTEWQVRREDDSVELYSTTGSLLQRIERGGRTFTFSYSTSSTPSNIAPRAGLLLTQSDAFGHSLSWQYNANAQVSQMTDPAGGVYQYGYDSAGNLTGVTYPDASSKMYEYNESANTGGVSVPHALTGVTDENATRYATFQYNSQYGYTFASNTQHAGGVDNYSLTYNVNAYYGSPNPLTTVVDPFGASRTYYFSDSPSLSYNRDTNQYQPAASGSGNVTQSEIYDANGNRATLTDFSGNVTNYVYDLTRNLETSRTEAYGTAQVRTITTTWDPNWRQPDLITEPNRTTGFTYDSLGNILTKTITDTSVTPNVARTWTYTYDSYGRMLTADGPRTDVTDKTTYAYYTCTTGYQCGQIHTITDALGHITTFNTYNAHGQPLTITDPNAVVTTLTYDLRQRLLSREVGTETTAYSYYPTGLLKTVTLPDSSTVTYTYDAAHRLTKITDSLGNYISYTLDNMGNRTAESSYDPSSTLHRTHTRVFNTLNELYQDINSAGTSAVTTTLTYDNNGNVLSSAAPLSRNTADQYDALNRLTKITDPNSGVTQFTYDANDNLATVIDPRNLTTSYTHNGFGDVTKLVSPDTGTSLSTYDSGGNLKTATDARSAVATYSYDAMNRVTQVAYADQTINFTYDAGTNGIGRLTGASDTNHSMSWTYDTHGRVTGKGQINGTISKSVGYGYTNGDLVSLVTPSGQTVTYTYTNHRITSITVNSTTLLSSVTYDPFGPATGWTWGNATASTRSFDKDGNPSQIVTAGVTNGYTIDNASRITGLSDSGLSSNSFTFGYDLLDRVTTGTSTGKTRGYTYDANSNRLTTTGTTASTETMSTTNNRLNSTSGGIVRTYGYDGAGNTTSYASNAYTFNDRGRMSKVLVGTNETDYIYNALGQLVKKSGAGGTTLLMYDEAGHILGEYSASGALIQETIWMGDLPVATIRPSGSTIVVYYVHSDHLGTPRKVTRPSDNGLMWRWDPDTFGSVAPNQNPSGLGTFTYNLRFPGQYSLNESGLYYNYFRDYDPQMGRYIESDPIGLKGGVNPYGYVSGNPVSFADPLGLLQRGNHVLDPDWQSIQEAEARIRQELAKSCSCHANPGADGCIPCDKVEALTNRLNTSWVSYDVYMNDNWCGTGDTPGGYVTIGPNAFSAALCHCLASTLYHELLHNTGVIDADSSAGPGTNSLEKKCIGNLCKKGK